jgi:hypothetical protein
VLPVSECDEEDPEMIYDDETEEFFALSIMYDSTCSPLTDSTGSVLKSLIA